MKILIAASEVVPFAKTGGLADVAGALPLALEAQGEEVAIVMPLYKEINLKKFKVQKVKDGIFASSIGKNIKVYFIDNDAYFGRPYLYGDKNGDYPDNLERFSFYCRRVLEMLKEVDFKPDIIHAHDWQAALIPVYLKTNFCKDAFYKNIKTLITIHNLGYQGLFDKEEFEKLGLDRSLFSMEGFEFFDRVNILKGGLIFSDFINTVSKTYSREIQTEEFGFGLEGVLGQRRNRLSGILNGLDYSIWGPATDKFISTPFSLKNVAMKSKNKEDLQKACNLPLNCDIPLIGIVSRLAEPKGFDIISEGIDEIVKMGLQLVILGVGNIKYHQILEDMVKKYPKVVSLHLEFNDPLAHKIYAGSDIFLMPSKYEPCGLGQLISLRYGTIPIVFKTGGLADTVNSNNGFVFNKYGKDELIKTIKSALLTFKDKKKWGCLVENALKCDHSWDESAKEYVKLYEKAKSVKK